MEATAPTMIPAVAMAIATLIILIAPFSKPAIISLIPNFNPSNRLRLFFFAVNTARTRIIIIKERIE